MLNTILKVLEWLTFLVLIVVAFISLSPLLKIKGMPSTFVVVSGSMEPTIRTGSVAFTKSIDQSKIIKGDIIAFASPSNPKDNILHRVTGIVQKDPILFQTKGDANAALDSWNVMGVGVKGKYYFAIPYLGYAGSFVRKPLGFLLLVILPAIIFIVSQILNIRRAIAEEVDRKVSHTLKSQNTFPVLVFFVSLLCLSRVPVAKAFFFDTGTITGLSLTIAESDSDDDHDKHCPDANEKGNHDDHGNGHDNNCDGDKDTGNNHDEEQEKDHDKEKDDNESEDSDKTWHHPKIESKLDGNKHFFSFSVDHLEDFYEISYQINYDTDHGPRGVMGREYINRREKYEKKGILLGSQSSGGTTVFDRGVKNIKIYITITRPDGTGFDIENTED